jgi:hypothetical protein
MEAADGNLAAGGVMIQHASRTMAAAVAQTLEALDVNEQDAAARKLAMRYAETIDQAGRHCSGCDDADCKRETYSWAMRWLAPLLLDVLTALGATPAARAALTKKGGLPADAEDVISQLRPRRRGV